MSDSKSSTFAIVILTFNAFLGTGLLALPYGLKNAGLIGGIVGLLFLGSISAYTIALVVKCKLIINQSISSSLDQPLLRSPSNLNYLDDGDYPHYQSPLPQSSSSPNLPPVSNKNSINSTASNESSNGSDSALIPKPVETYVDLAEYSYGNRGKNIIMAALLITQIGFCCVYFIFIIKNLNTVSGLDEWIGAGVMAAVFMFLIYLPSLKFLAPTSTIGYLSLLFVSALIFACLNNDSVHIQSFSDYTLIDLSHFSLFFGVACYSFAIHGIAMSLEKSMRYPELFFKMLFGTTACVIAMYIGTATSGYLSFGDDVDADVTNNLSDVFDSTLINVVKSFLMVALSGSYPLMMFPVVEIITSNLSPAAQESRFVRFILRFSLVATTAVIGRIIPYFGVFVSLAGAFSTSIVSYIFPPLCYLTIQYKRKQVTTSMWVVNLFVLIFGIGATGFSTTKAVIQLVSCFQDSDQDACK